MPSLNIEHVTTESASVALETPNPFFGVNAGARVFVVMERAFDGIALDDGASNFQRTFQRTSRGAYRILFRVHCAPPLLPRSHLLADSLVCRRGKSPTLPRRHWRWPLEVAPNNAHSAKLK